MARYLLDTHTFIWLVTHSLRLRREVDEIIRDPVNDVFVSIASIWEISIKVGLNKMPALPGEPEELMRVTGLIQLDISVDHAKLAGRLPLHHRDPFDRMLVAPAQVENLILITDDWKIEQYGVPILRP